MRMVVRLAVALAVILAGAAGAVVLFNGVKDVPAAQGATAGHHHAAHGARGGGHQVRTYYIAADEVDWNYAPQGRNVVAGRPFTADERVFVQRGAGRVGSSYRKALYREYTDARFARLKRRDPRWSHTGLLGPVIRAEVGDTIRVVFKNNGRRPYGIHAHGVRYAKGSEGAPYADGTAGADKGDDGIPPGATRTYTYEVPSRAGPAPHDGSSVMWMYHSHVDEVRDTNSGLVGPMIIYADGSLRPDGSVAGIDREFVTFYSVMNENQSWYVKDDVQRFAGKPSSVDLEDEGFQESNLMHSINGYVYGNGPMMRARKGERVRWYVMTLGTEVDLHTPHWHGQTVTAMGMRTDVVQLLAGGMVTADMVADNPGVWLLHCHVNDHIAAGMTTRYEVTP